MPATIHAIDLDGRLVDVEPDTVLSLSPDRSDTARTRFFLADKVVTADGRYEDWMTEFAQDWTGHPG